LRWKGGRAHVEAGDNGLSCAAEPAVLDESYRIRMISGRIELARPEPKQVPLRASPQGTADPSASSIWDYDDFEVSDAWIARPLQMGERPPDEGCALDRHPEASAPTGWRRVDLVLNAPRAKHV